MSHLSRMTLSGDPQRCINWILIKSSGRGAKEKWRPPRRRGYQRATVPSCHLEGSVWREVKKRGAIHTSSLGARLRFTHGQTSQQSTEVEGEKIAHSYLGSSVITSWWIVANPPLLTYPARKFSLNEKNRHCVFGTKKTVWMPPRNSLRFFPILMWP